MLYLKYIEMKTNVLLVVLLLLVPLIGKAQDDTITIGRENNMIKTVRLIKSQMMRHCVPFYLRNNMP